MHNPIIDDKYITLPKAVGSDFKVGLIATMPRSGTWYNHYFFHFYDHLLRGKAKIPLKVEIVPVRRRDTIGLDVLFICHTICPGFHRYQGRYRESWDKLLVSSERHIRDGSVGRWKAHLNDDDLAKIQKRLECFDLSLSDFDIE